MQELDVCFTFLPLGMSGIWKHVNSRTNHSGPNAKNRVRGRGEASMKPRVDL
jgi:hypothetical protein